MKNTKSAAAAQQEACNFMGEKWGWSPHGADDIEESKHEGRKTTAEVMRTLPGLLPKSIVGRQ